MLELFLTVPPPFYDHPRGRRSCWTTPVHPNASKSTHLDDSDYISVLRLVFPCFWANDESEVFEDLATLLCHVSSTLGVEIRGRHDFDWATLDDRSKGKA